MSKRASPEAALTSASKSHLATRFLELQELRKAFQREEQFGQLKQIPTACSLRRAQGDTRPLGGVA
jgi:hypothetical protein